VAVHLATASSSRLILRKPRLGNCNDAEMMI
jgi:hypothetical protein